MKIKEIIEKRKIDFDNLTDETRWVIEQRLKAPFTPGEMELRPGRMNYKTMAAKPLVYIDPRSVAKRLDQVFGSGCWGVDHISVTAALDEKYELVKNLEGDGKMARDTKGLFVGSTCSIVINRGQYQTTVSNVGDKSLKDPADNKLTASQAQAFKRAATLVGIGSYLYDIKLEDLATKKIGGMSQFPPMSSPQIIGLLEKDNHIQKALKANGFFGLCEVTGEEVPWHIAAAAMDRFGMVLCEAEARKLTN